MMERFVEYYNATRLHSAIGYIAPLDFMHGKANQIWLAGASGSLLAAPSNESARPARARTAG